MAVAVLRGEEGGDGINLDRPLLEAAPAVTASHPDLCRAKKMTERREDDVGRGGDRHQKKVHPLDCATAAAIQALRVVMRCLWFSLVDFLAGDRLLC